MEEQYYDRGAAIDLDEPLGEDGPVERQTDRGLFGHGRSSYETPPMVAGYRPSMAGYGGEYEPRPEVVYEGGYGGPPPVMYSAPVRASDLSTGLMDSPVQTRPDYTSSGYGRSDAYAERGHHHGQNKEDADEELDEQRKHKHYAEAAAAAAIGYGLYERHQKNEAEEKLEELGYDSHGNKMHKHRYGDY